MRRARPLILLLTLTPLLLAATCRKKDKGGDEDIISEPEVRLQVISVDPATVTADRRFTVTVYGSSFEADAEVWFGDRQATKIGYRNTNTLTVSGPALPAGVYDVTVVSGATRSRASLRGGLEARGRDGPEGEGDECRKAVFYFDFDSYRLRADTTQQMSAIARCLAARDWSVRLEGHSDERGTTEYNLALGQRRASAVKDALIAQAVSPSRIRTVSYGEERPAVRESNESAWAKNRRVEMTTQQ